MTPQQLALPSRLVVNDPFNRLLRFCQEEYAYYDGLPSGDANRIEPLDIVATVGLNSRIDTAVKVRTVHRGMAGACEPLLQQISTTAHLVSFDRLDLVHDLFEAAMTSKYVLLATATKVLHRKRPELIPVLDSVVVGHYVQREEEKALVQRSWESRPAAADVGRITIERLREDLIQALDALSELREQLKAEGFPLSHVRVLDILVWTEKESVGSYRNP